MKVSIRSWLVTPLAALVLVGFALTPVAQARGVGGDGGGGARAGGGGRAAAAGGGGSRQSAQVNNSRADVRSNDVRSSSVNSVNSNRNTNISSNTNVNANRNVNVNVNSGRGGWDNDYHPVAGAMAVGAAVAVTSAAIGSMVQSVPSNCVPVSYGGMVYQQCGSAWYQPQGSQFVVVNPPY